MVLVPKIGYLVPELRCARTSPSFGRVPAEVVKVSPYFLPGD
jgi:hypothetical protein